LIEASTVPMLAALPPALTPWRCDAVNSCALLVAARLISRQSTRPTISSMIDIPRAGPCRR
jgi:hypothetical protein